ncbi:hypothetical protein FQZ97_1137760 [compost metagenome]
MSALQADASVSQARIMLQLSIDDDPGLGSSFVLAVIHGHASNPVDDIFQLVELLGFLDVR